MDRSQCLDALSALSQETRLDVFRLLTRAEPVGMCAGDIAEAVGGLQNTVSTNLAILARAGLIRSAREGRSVRYFANLDGMSRLLSFLIRIGEIEDTQNLVFTISTEKRRNPTIEGFKGVLPTIGKIL